MNEDLTEISKKAHLKSDVDSSIRAQHHTLGKGPLQSAPGNHEHDYAATDHTHDAPVLAFNDLSDVDVAGAVVGDMIVLTATGWEVFDPEEQALVPTLAAVVSHDITIGFTRPGLVHCEGYIDIDIAIPAGMNDLGVTIPEKFRPNAQQHSPGAVFTGTTDNYRFRFGTDGFFGFQQSAPNSQFAPFSVQWTV